MLKPSICVLALMAIGAEQARANPWQASDEQIEACRKTEDRVRRLNCFDALFHVASPEPAQATSAPARPSSPIRSLAFSQERERGSLTAPLVRVRPWGSERLSPPPEASNAAREPGESPAGADVFVSIAERPATLDPPVPLDDRAVMLLTCEQDITGLYFVLPEPVADGRARVEIAGDRGSPMTLNWRDFGEGGVILAGRGLESIALIRSLWASRRLHVRVDYPKGPRAFVFEVEKLDEAVRPLRQACHW